MIARFSDNALLHTWQTTLQKRDDDGAIWGTDGIIRRTFADIEQESRELEKVFVDLPKGAIVGVQIGNNERWPAVLLALLRRELITLPVGRHIESTELALALETGRVAALVTMQDRELKVSPGPYPEGVRWAGSAPHLLKLTSGNTSVPRMIRFRAEQLVADADSICLTMGFGPRDLNFGVIPFSHSYGFSNLVTPLICQGVPLVTSEDRMPRAILNDLAHTEATVFPGMPVFFQKFTEMQNTPALPSLRLCISAGAPLPKVVGERFSERYKLKIHSFYGSSECGGIAYDASEDLQYEEGFVGLPMKGVNVEMLREGASPIAVRSAAVGDGYFPESDETVLGGSRFVPGDLVRQTGAGLFIAGRVSEVINIAGRKLNPLEVEARISELPGVKQVVVFGVPSELRGEEAVACIATREVDASAVWKHCQAKLSAWQMPRELWMVTDIPSAERGKVDRRALAAEFLAQKDRAAKTRKT